MAELHIIGQIVGGYEFPSASIFCKWRTITGSTWNLLEGKEDGQTQVDHPKDRTFAKWCHPIDIHLSCQGLQEWPKLCFEVWHEDVFGRNELYGYGFCHIPSTPGFHEFDCVTWKPIGSYKDRFTSFFMGGGPELSEESVIYSNNDRIHLRTQASGKVKVKLSIITRNFEKYGIEC